MKISFPRPVKRLIFSFAILTTFIILSLLLEPRRRSLSCRTIWSCANPFSQPSYQITTVPEEQQVAVTETTLADGTVKFHRKLKTEVPSALFLVLTRDGHSWSRDFQSTRRSIYDFLDLLARTALEPQNISLGLMTESKVEFDLLKQATDEIPLGRVTVLLRSGMEMNGEEGRKGGDGEGQVSDRWRASMARQRNYLMHRTLLDEKHVIWVDAGVVEFSPDMVQTMMRHADARNDVGIVTARCERNEVQNYDTRAWAISNDSPLLSSPAGLDGTNREALVSELEKSRVLVPEVIKGSVDSDLFQLNSVGSTILYIKADLVRQGLIFPWWKVIGATWKEEGWAGLDTEGLCFLTGQIQRAGCYVLGGTHRVRHTDWG